jgi:hypothetical protein
MSFLSKLLGRRDKPVPVALPSDPIDAFWAWWQEASVELAAACGRGGGLSEEQVDAISERVRAIDAGLAWETGPGTNNSEHHFALSAEGDAALRVLTQRWLSRAPQPSKSWQYYPARQGSGPDARLSLNISGREFVFADFKLATEVDDDRAVVNVVVYHPLFAAMSEDERLQPLFLFLDDLLGEDGVTSWVGAVSSASEEPAGATTSGALVELVRKLRAEWSDETVSVLRGQRGDGVAVVAMVRRALKRLDHLLHDHHVELMLELREPNAEGFYSPDEGEELESFEEGLIEELGHRAVWIGHETFAGKRVVHFHAGGSADVQDAIDRYCEVHGGWDKALSVTYDPEWTILERY